MLSWQNAFCKILMFSSPKKILFFWIDFVFAILCSVRAIWFWRQSVWEEKCLSNWDFFAQNWSFLVLFLEGTVCAGKILNNYVIITQTWSFPEYSGVPNTSSDSLKTMKTWGPDRMKPISWTDPVITRPISSGTDNTRQLWGRTVYLQHCPRLQSVCR